MDTYNLILLFPLILLQAKAGGVRQALKRASSFSFPLILLQAKAGGKSYLDSILLKSAKVSINSPSGEGGGTSGVPDEPP